MNGQPERLSLARQWVSKADEDLHAAEYLATLEEGCPYAAVCFHSQQCAEKYLKALLVWRSIDFPRTHDLRALIIRLAADEEADRLSDHATVDRYPGDREPVGREEADRAVKAARLVRDFVRGRLPA